MPKPTAVAGQRFLAYVIDTLIISAIIAVLWLLLTDKLPKETIDPSSGGFDIGDKRYAFSDDHAWKRSVWAVGSIAAVLVVSILVPAIKGSSPGRAAAGIRLVNGQGQAPGIGRAFLRWVAWLIDQFPYFIPLVGPILTLASGNNQRLGDMLAGTYTVRREAAGHPLGLQDGPRDPLLSTGGAGWHPDPYGQARLRYWDGSGWTEHTAA